MTHDLANGDIVLTCPNGVSETYYSPGVTCKASQSVIILTGTQNYAGCNGTYQLTKVNVTIEALGPNGTSCTTLFSIPLQTTFRDGSAPGNSTGSDATLRCNHSLGLFQDEDVYLGKTENNRGPFVSLYYRITYKFNSFVSGIECLTPNGLQDIHGTVVLEVANTKFSNQSVEDAKYRETFAIVYFIFL